MICGKHDPRLLAKVIVWTPDAGLMRTTCLMMLLLFSGDELEHFVSDIWMV